MSIFKEYPSIRNATPIVLEEVEKILSTYKTPITWVAQEKIDGQNMQIITDGEKVWFASRNCLLNDGTKDEKKNLIQFFGSTTSHKQYEPMALDLHRNLTKSSSSKEKIHIYGEYCGGYYGDGYLVQRKPALNTILYSHDFEFVIFDIIVGTKMLSPPEVVSSAMDVGYHKVCKPLHQGTLSSLLKKDVMYTTTIPELFDLEPLPKMNIAEGFVLKPLNPTVEWKDERIPLYLKVKREEFKDASKRRPNPNIPDEFSKLNGMQRKLVADLVNGITMVRLESLRGKMIVEWSQYNTKEKSHLLLKDVVKEYLVEQCQEKARPYMQKVIDKLIDGYPPLRKESIEIVDRLA